MLITIATERSMLRTQDEGENRREGKAVPFIRTYQDELWGETGRKKRSFTFFSKTVGKIPKGD